MMLNSINSSPAIVCLITLTSLVEPGFGMWMPPPTIYRTGTGDLRLWARDCGLHVTPL